MTSPYHAQAYKLYFNSRRTKPKPKSWRLSADVINHLRKEPESLTESTFVYTGKEEWTFLGLTIQFVGGDNIIELIK